MVIKKIKRKDMRLLDAVLEIPQPINNCRRIGDTPLVDNRAADQSEDVRVQPSTVPHSDQPFTCSSINANVTLLLLKMKRKRDSVAGEGNEPKKLTAACTACRKQKVRENGSNLPCAHLDPMAHSPSDQVRDGE